MKLITLNTWGARVREPFHDFVKKYQDIDVFCFQEIYHGAKGIMDVKYPEINHDLFNYLQRMLPDHNGYFRPVLKGVYGVAIFIKKEIAVLEEGEILIHKSLNPDEISGYHDRNLQWMKFEIDGRIMTVINVHGLWNSIGKMDTEPRLKQSRLIKSFVDSKEGNKILCGDFNLNPDTESLRIAGRGMKNLVKEYEIASTRTSFYKKEGKFADYIFTSGGLEVKDFKVLPEEVSDHLALFLET